MELFALSCNVICLLMATFASTTLLEGDYEILSNQYTHNRRGMLVLFIVLNASFLLYFSYVSFPPFLRQFFEKCMPLIEECRAGISKCLGKISSHRDWPGATKYETALLHTERQKFEGEPVDI